MIHLKTGSEVECQGHEGQNPRCLKGLLSNSNWASLVSNSEIQNAPKSQTESQQDTTSGKFHIGPHV